LVPEPKPKIQMPLSPIEISIKMKTRSLLEIIFEGLLRLRSQIELLQSLEDNLSLNYRLILNLGFN